MVDLLYCPADLLFFDMALSYYYINLNASIICCLSSGDIYLSFGISMSLIVLIAFSEALLIKFVIDFLA